MFRTFQSGVPGVGRPAFFPESPKQGICGDHAQVLGVELCGIGFLRFRCQRNRGERKRLQHRLHGPGSQEGWGEARYEAEADNGDKDAKTA